MTDPDNKIEPEDSAEIVLRRGLQTEPLSAEALQRIRAATQQEWLVAAGKVERPRYWNRHAGIAAALVLVSVVAALTLFNKPADSLHGELGTLTRADKPGAIEQRRWQADRILENGAPLHAGQRILSRGGTRVDLPGAGSMRLAAGTGIEIVSANLVKLVDGNLYFDFPPAHTPPIDLRIQTPAGTFTHVGTQFQLAVRDGTTLLQVREGQVRWTSATGDVLAAAGTQLTIDSNGKATREPVTATGANWSWVEGLAPDFDIENRSLLEFLRYIARETGRTLVFANVAMESHANTTLLHGATTGLAPLEALSNVMATTSIRFTLGADSIRIESGGDAEQTTK